MQSYYSAPMTPVAPELTATITATSTKLTAQIQKLTDQLAKPFSSLGGSGGGYGSGGSILQRRGGGLLQAIADMPKEGEEGAGPGSFFEGFFKPLLKGLESPSGGGDGTLYGSLLGKDPAETPASPKDGSAKDADPTEAAAKITQADGQVTGDKVNQDSKRVASDKKAWGTMIGNAIAGSKKLRKIHKALAIGSVIIDTAQGIQKAFAEHGFPGGLLPAAVIAASGAIQISAIKGQAHDGIDNIPSTGTYLLEKGERVVDKRLNRDLSLFLSGQTGQAVSRSDTAITHSPTVNMTFNGAQDPEAVRANRGAVETILREIYADHALANPFDR